MQRERELRVASLEEEDRFRPELLYLINAVFDFDIEEGQIGCGRFDFAGAVAPSSVVALGDGYCVAGRAALLAFDAAVFQGGQGVAQGCGHRLGGERQRVARLLHRVQDVEKSRVAAPLQLPHAVPQHLGNGLLPARFVQLVGRPLVEQEHGRFLQHDPQTSFTTHAALMIG